MGLLDAVNPNDPRLSPGAYLTDGTRLVELMDVNDRRVTILNCRTEALTSTTPWDIVRSFQLVRAAPVTPDRMESD